MDKKYKTSEAHRKRCKKYYQEHKEQSKKYHEKWRLNNPEKVREIGKRYYYNHRDKYKVWAKDYFLRVTNPRRKFITKELKSLPVEELLEFVGYYDDEEE